MKKLFAAALVAALTIVSVSADSVFRVDINGISGAKDKQVKIKLTSPKQAGAIALYPQGWAGKNKEFTLSGETKVGKDWKEIKFAVTPEKDGMINFSYCGNWAPKKEQMTWVLLSNFKMDGKLIANGDLAKIAKNKQPEGFWMPNTANLIPSAGPKGAAAVLVQHDSRIFRSFTLKGGKTYIFSVMAKAGEAPKKK